MFSPRTYDILKQFAQLVLPALGAFYFALAEIWGLPRANEVVGTIAAVNTLLGVMVVFSSKLYEASGEKYEGVVLVQENPETGAPVVNLELKSSPEEFLDHIQQDSVKSVTFKSV